MDIDGGGSDNDSYVSDAASYASVDCFEDDNDYKESSSSSDEEDAEDSFKRRLTTWAVEANIARCHVNSLLKLLKTDGGLGYLPVDWRTLAKTGFFGKIFFCDIPAGRYVHLVWVVSPDKTLHQHLFDLVSTGDDSTSDNV